MHKVRRHVRRTAHIVTDTISWSAIVAHTFATLAVNASYQGLSWPAPKPDSRCFTVSLKGVAHTQPLTVLARCVPRLSLVLLPLVSPLGHILSTCSLRSVKKHLNHMNFDILAHSYQSSHDPEMADRCRPNSSITLQSQEDWPDRVEQPSIRATLTLEQSKQHVRESSFGNWATSVHDGLTLPLRREPLFQRTVQILNLQIVQLVRCLSEDYDSYYWANCVSAVVYVWATFSAGCFLNRNESLQPLCCDSCWAATAWYGLS